jgi:hypothetical protein
MHRRDFFDFAKHGLTGTALARVQLNSKEFLHVE